MFIATSDVLFLQLCISVLSKPLEIQNIFYQAIMQETSILLLSFDPDI